MNELILLAHVLFGMACLVAAVWVFVDALNVSEANQCRIRKVSCAAAGLMWLSFLIGGYWYVTFYKGDESAILKGPWPFAHNFIMVTKAYLAIPLLATYLPIAASNNLSANRAARRLVLWVTGMVVVLALVMDREGAIVATGVELGLMAK